MIRTICFEVKETNRYVPKRNSGRSIGGTSELLVMDWTLPSSFYNLTHDSISFEKYVFGTNNMSDKLKKKATFYFSQDHVRFDLK